MRKVAKITSNILKGLARMVEPGISLLDIEAKAEELLKLYKVESFNKGYKPVWATKPYPAITCTSVNSCVAHGIPTNYKLKDGDIVNIDLGIKNGKYCGDSALTVPVGKISQKHKDLLKYARYATFGAINQIRGGVEVSKIGLETMKLVNSLGYKVNWMLCGHGIGFGMHELPQIPFHHASGKKVVNNQVYDVGSHYKRQFGGIKLKAGQVVCIEPMVTCGKDSFGAKHIDGWSHMTKDGEYSAMFEAMVLVTENGFEILTDHFDEKGLCL